MVVVEQVASLPAGGPEGIATAAVSFPQTSLAEHGPPAAVWIPPLLRVGADGDGLVLAQDRDRARVAVYRLSGDRSPIVTDAEPVVDVLPEPDGAGAWTLERARDADGALNVLRRIAGDGTTEWRRTGRWTARAPAWDRLDAALERLLGDRAGAAYAVTVRPATVVARIGDQGELTATRDLAGRGAHPVMSGDGTLGWVAIDPSQGERAWHVLAPGEEIPERAALPPEAGGPGAVPIGLDSRGRAYLAEALALTCAVPGGGVEWSFRTDGLAVAPDGALLAATTEAGMLEVTEWRDGDAAGRHRFAVPLLDPGRELSWRLIASEGDALLLWGGEGGRGPGVLATVGADGRLIELADPAPEDARLRGWWPAAARDWQVDEAGRAYLALAGPEQVAILRVSSA